MSVPWAAKAQVPYGKVAQMPEGLSGAKRASGARLRGPREALQVYACVHFLVDFRIPGRSGRSTANPQSALKAAESVETVERMQQGLCGAMGNSMLFNPSHEKYVSADEHTALYAEASIVTRIMSGLFGVASFSRDATWAGVLGTLG